MTEKFTYADTDTVPDLRDTSEFEQFAETIENLLPKCPVSYGYIKRKFEKLSRTKADYYRIGLALKHLEKHGKITIDDSNPHITKFIKGGREMPKLANEDWKKKFKVYENRIYKK